MTTSSAQETFSITLTDDQLAALTSTIELDTITLNSTVSGSSTTMAYPCYTTGSSTISYTTLTSGTSFCIPPLTINNISVWGNTEWVDSFPSWSRVEEMCKEYPGLKIAFDRFKNTYNLVKDDFDLPPEKRIKP